MEVRLGGKGSNQSYILSGKKAFFHRYCDTGFRNKWTGFWAMPHKFLEYFAFKVNGEWLCPESSDSFFLDDIHSEHRFRTGNMEIKESIFVPEGNKSLVCRIIFENPNHENTSAEIELEAAINIRLREENWHGRKYVKKISNGRVAVSSSEGCIVYGSFPEGALELDEEYRDHYPSGEHQRCFIPGKYKTQLNVPAGGRVEVSFVFGCGESDIEAMNEFDISSKRPQELYFEKRNSYSKILSNSKFESDLGNLDELFKMNVVAMEKLAFSSKHGLGFFAGYPWFTQFWGRDSSLMIPAVVDYSNFEGAKNALATLARLQSEEGEIPHTVYASGEVDFNSTDSTLLWIIALNHYLMNSGDLGFLKQIEGTLVKALQWCKKRSLGKDGFIVHGKDTWMDTLDRSTEAVEIESFWIEALADCGNMFDLLGMKDFANSLKRQSSELRQKFDKKFWNEGEHYYFDRIVGDSKDKRKTINAIFPLLFDLSKHTKKTLDVLESEVFRTSSGVATVAKDEEGYNPAGYHTGGTWGFTSMAVGCAEFADDRTDNGLRRLNLMWSKLFEDCLGSLGEVWNSETGELIGACHQGWSSAFTIRCMDEYFLGLKVNAFENSIILSPHLKDGMRIERSKRIGDDLVNLRIERKSNKLNVDYSSKKDKTYKIIMAPRI